MFNIHKVSLDTIKYWLVEPYATFSLEVRGQKSSTPSGVVVGKILRSTITTNKGLVQKFKNYCERVIFSRILLDVYICQK